MTRLRYRVERSRFDELQDRIGDLRRTLFPAIAKRLEEHFDMIFTTEGANIGRPWAPLSQVTLKIDRKIGRNLKPVEQTPGVGLIRRSLIKEGPYSLRQITHDRVRVGTKHSMAAIHERGQPARTRDGKKLPAVPARALAGTSPELIRDLEKIIERHLDADDF